MLVAAYGLLACRAWARVLTLAAVLAGLVTSVFVVLLGAQTLSDVLLNCANAAMLMLLWWYVDRSYIRFYLATATSQLPGALDDLGQTQFEDGSPL